MKKLMVATLAIGALTVGAAQAADLGPRRAAPAVLAGPPACAAQQFGGFYIGASGGSVYHEAHRLDSDGFMTDNSGWTLNKWGGIAGGQAGFNWTTCSTVWGVEIDGSWVGVKNSFRDNPNALGVNNTIDTKMNTLFTARIRSGVALDNLLLYVTGGVAGAQFKTAWTSSPNSVEFKEWRWGWVAGVGTEWAWTPSWSLKSEFLYASFADRDHTATLGGALFSFRHSDSVWISRIGVNYRWGGAAPVAARY